VFRSNPVGRGMFAGLLLEILLPRTDAGVLAQFLAWVITFPLALAVVWRKGHEHRLFVVGIWVFVLSCFGLRALH